MADHAFSTTTLTNQGYARHNSGPTVTTVTPKGHKIARGPDGRLLSAIVTGAGGLALNRYSDALPEAVAATLTVESSGVTSASLQVLRSGVARLAYCLSGTAQFRLSTDQGASVGVAITIASTYTRIADYQSEEDGMWVAMLLASSAWFVTVGELGDDGATWTFTTPASRVTSAADADACLSRRSDGVWEFAHITSAGVATVVRCKSLLKDGTGVWA